MEQNTENGQKEENAVVSEPQKQKKKIAMRVGFIVLALLFLVAAFLGGFAAGRSGVDGQERSLLWMIDAVEKNYREEVSRDELFDRLYDALELDKFCTHYTPEELTDVLDESEGHNSGYGLSLTTENGAVRVVRVIQNSPAAFAGLKKGMYVYSCGAGDAATSSAVVAYLNGETGTATLSCGFSPDGSDARDVSMQRAAYLASYCVYSDSDKTFSFRGEEGLVLTETGEGTEGLPADTALVTLMQFEGNADEEFTACLNKMKERGRKNLILDLRGNGGGYLTLFCGISAHLLRNAEGKAPLIAEARFRDGRVHRYTASGNDFSSYFSADSEVRVLADESTASASEALIGALIGYGTCDYGDIYVRKGEGPAKTYGKGVMQSRLVAPDGNAMMLTVANIYWPNGICIHDKGITEEDGAVPVSAPFLPGERDVFLESVLRALP